MDAILVQPKQENFHLSRTTLESLPYKDKIIKKVVNKIEQEQLTEIREDTLGVLFEKLIREQEKKDFDEAFSQNLASDNFSEFCKQLGDKAHLVTIKQARHGDFSDVPFLQNILAVQNLFSSKSEMRESLCIGDLEPYRIVSITNDYIVWFFDKYLKGKDRKFPEYSEVIVER